MVSPEDPSDIIYAEAAPEVWRSLARAFSNFLTPFMLFLGLDLLDIAVTLGLLIIHPFIGCRLEINLPSGL